MFSVPTAHKDMPSQPGYISQGDYRHAHGVCEEMQMANVRSKRTMTNWHQKNTPTAAAGEGTKEG